MARHWVKVYITMGRQLAQKLPDHEWNALTKLCLWTRYRDNTIRGRDGQPMRQEEIAAAIGKSLRQTKSILAALERRGVVLSFREGKAKHYRISGLVAYRGGEGALLREREYDPGKKATEPAATTPTGTRKSATHCTDMVQSIAPIGGQEKGRGGVARGGTGRA